MCVFDGSLGEDTENAHYYVRPNFISRAHSKTSNIQWVRSVVADGFYAFFVWPFHEIYRRGYWHGRTNAEICAVLTQYRTDFWMQHATECVIIVEAHFDSLYVYAQFIAYIILVLFLMRFLLRQIGC